MTPSTHFPVTKFPHASTQSANAQPFPPLGEVGTGVVGKGGGGSFPQPAARPAATSDRLKAKRGAKEVRFMKASILFRQSNRQTIAFRVENALYSARDVGHVCQRQDAEFITRRATPPRRRASSASGPMK